MQPAYAEFGRLLRVARRKNGLGQGALAARVGMSRTSITNIERGRQRVLLHQFLELAAAVGADPVQMLPTATGLSIDSEILIGLDGDTRDWVIRIVAEAANTDGGK